MDTIYRAIINIMEDNVKKVRGIKSIYYGDPGEIAKDLLPAITVYPITTDLEARGIGNVGVDFVAHEVGISIIYDMRSQFNKRPFEVKIVQTMMETLMERDDNKNLRSDTVIGALRLYTSMNLEDEVQFIDRFHVDYGVNDTRGFPTIEAAITFTASFRPQRPIS